MLSSTEDRFDCQVGTPEDLGVKINEQCMLAPKAVLSYGTKLTSSTTNQSDECLDDATRSEFGTVLSNKGILEGIKSKKLLIFPFRHSHLSTSSYDVSLGEWYFRESPAHAGASQIYNPYSESMVHRVWGKPQRAQLVSEWQSQFKIITSTIKQQGQETTKNLGLDGKESKMAYLLSKDPVQVEAEKVQSSLLNRDPRELSLSNSSSLLENIAATDRVIFLMPGETILAHTEEFIGGIHNVTTMMKARSSMGRNFIEVCKCAGWGDVGYTNRWTMEITNNSRHYTIPLVVGRRIAQIVFFATTPTLESDSHYAVQGKYQSLHNNLEQLRHEWSPMMCLPQMYKDKELISEGKRSENL